MNNPIVTFIIAFATAVGKQALVKGSPVAVGILENLYGAGADLIGEELDPQLSSDEKKELEQDALNVVKTAWAVSEQEGLLLAEDSAALIAQAAASQIAGAIGM